MIVIDTATPRWLRELDRFIHLHGLIIIHGNILDLASYPVRAAERTYWTETDLRTFFRRYLIGLNYELVGEFDPIDGLSFAVEGMERIFERTGTTNTLTSPPPPAPPTTTTNVATPTSPTTTDLETAVRGISRALANRDIPCVFVMHFASRLAIAPDRLTRVEHGIFTRLLKASLDAREVVRGEKRWNNSLILVCERPNDLPAFLYVDNPRARTVRIEPPNSADRTRFLHGSYASFHGATPEQPPSAELTALFAALTEGLSYHELRALIGLSLREAIPISQTRALTDRYKYGVTESEWDRLDRARLTGAETLMRGRVKGQEPALHRVLEVVKRARLGLSAGTSGASQRPRGVLFFAGPTGVGKTELAKALAELLFGREERMVRFDMSEYAASHAEARLLGAPPGYVGYEEGGKLTNAMKEQPFSVLLFDEIEKAHTSIFDKFLQILDDGRITDGHGETVYFSESVIIFTSNLGAVGTTVDGRREILISPEQPYSELRKHILAAIRHHFNVILGRPEILNRFGDNFVVFDFIRPPVAEQILDRLLAQLTSLMAEQRQLQLHFSDNARTTLINLAYERLEHGGRGIRNLVDAAVVNPLAAMLFDTDIAVGTSIRITSIIDHGEAVGDRFSLDIQHD